MREREKTILTERYEGQGERETSHRERKKETCHALLSSQLTTHSVLLYVAILKSRP